MRLALALGAAVAALTMAAYAQTDRGARVIVHRGGPEIEFDADRDGWVTRAEASAAADRLFGEMDNDDDGRLTSSDHTILHSFDIRVDVPDVEVLEGEDGDRRIRIIRRGPDGELVEREIELAQREIERAEREAARAARQAERAVREAERAVRDAERRVEREVVVIHGGGHGEWTQVVPPVPPVPPIPASPGMFMMLIASSDEADLDGDGALSREEFRAQQLRFFDASDANGDGRIRFEPPPEPPQPPVPPEPPRDP